jgi:hypothetical protein
MSSGGKFRRHDAQFSPADSVRPSNRLQIPDCRLPVAVCHRTLASTTAPCPAKACGRLDERSIVADRSQVMASSSFSVAVSGTQRPGESVAVRLTAWFKALEETVGVAGVLSSHPDEIAGLTDGDLSAIIR